MKIPCGKKSQLCKVIVASSVFALFCAAAQAQPQPHRPVGRPAGGPPPGHNIRERLLALPPEARQNFGRNADRAVRMSPEERDVRRKHENLRRDATKREAEAALSE